MTILSLALTLGLGVAPLPACTAWSAPYWDSARQFLGCAPGRTARYQLCTLRACRDADGRSYWDKACRPWTACLPAPPPPPVSF